MRKLQSVKDVLTWAELYLTNIRNDLRLVIPTVRKIAPPPEFILGAARLRGQIQDANRTVAELRKIIGVWSGSLEQGHTYQSKLLLGWSPEIGDGVYLWTLPSSTKSPHHITLRVLSSCPW